MAQDKTNKPPVSKGTKGASNNAAGAPERKSVTNPFKFLGEVRQEGRKVTWTSRNETLISTVMVLIMSTIAALYFWGVDSFIGWTVTSLLSFGA